MILWWKVISALFIVLKIKQVLYQTCEIHTCEGYHDTIFLKFEPKSNILRAPSSLLYWLVWLISFGCPTIIVGSTQNTKAFVILFLRTFVFKILEFIASEMNHKLQLSQAIVLFLWNCSCPYRPDVAKPDSR